MQHEHKVDALLPITQDHDGGAAAAAKVRQLGHEGLRAEGSPRGRGTFHSPESAAQF